MRRQFVFTIVFVIVFFFQAEDGIRDLVRSRGLGDVYKRQVLGGGIGSKLGSPAALRNYMRLNQAVRSAPANLPGYKALPYPVSYTHLTLPTIYSV